MLAPILKESLRIVNPPSTAALRAARADRLLNQHIDRVAAQPWEQATVEQDRRDRIQEAFLRWQADAAHADVSKTAYEALLQNGGRG